MKSNGLTRTTAHLLLLKLMEPHRKKLNDLIEQAAKRRNVSSEWDTTLPKKKSQNEFEVAQVKGNLDEQYKLFDR